MSDNFYPQGDQLKQQVAKRARAGSAWYTIFIAATTVAIIALVALLINVINQAFGYVALENKIQPSALVTSVGEDAATVALSDLSIDQHLTILQDNISNGRGRKLERDQRFLPSALVFESQAKWDEVCADAEPPAGCLAPAAQPATSTNSSLMKSSKPKSPKRGTSAPRSPIAPKLTPLWPKLGQT